MIEAIDLAPTFVEAAGGVVADHILEGRSLAPYLHGHPCEDRKYVISEYDYSVTHYCAQLGLAPRDARMFMVFDGRWKLIHFEGGFRPMLFDLETDPSEIHDLGATDEHKAEIDRLYSYLAQWGRRLSQRVTRSEDDIINMRGKSLRKGILPFLKDGSEVPEDWTRAYRGTAAQDFVSKQGKTK